MATFILIHGSWHGAWCWYKVVARLEAQGHRALAPDLPCHGKNWGSPAKVTLQDYVDAVCAKIDEVEGPVVVVAHSRGGMVASQVAEQRSTRIAKTIYLAAYLIPPGESVLEWALEDTDSMIRENLDLNMDEGWDMLRAEAFREALYHDCSDDDVMLATHC